MLAESREFVTSVPTTRHAFVIKQRTLVTKTYIEDIGVQSPGGGVRVREAIPEPQGVRGLEEGVALRVIAGVGGAHPIGEVSVRGKLNPDT